MGGAKQHNLKTATVMLYTYNSTVHSRTNGIPFLLKTAETTQKRFVEHEFSSFFINFFFPEDPAKTFFPALSTPKTSPKIPEPFFLFYGFQKCPSADKFPSQWIFKSSQNYISLDAIAVRKCIIVGKRANNVLNSGLQETQERPTTGADIKKATLPTPNLTTLRASGSICSPRPAN